MAEFSHIRDSHTEMVDITEKEDINRQATAKGKIYLNLDTLRAIREGSVVKGNVLATARVAATLAIKDTPRIIPMCHSLLLGAISIAFSEEVEFIEVTVQVKTNGKTGVEMEALTGVSVALLTIWDMVKSAEKDSQGQYPITKITDIYVVEKKKSKR